MPESVLCAAARARGASCLEVDGFLVPGAFADAAAEYRALRDGAAVVDIAFRARIRVTGSDRVEFLQGMLSNDVKALAPGAGRPALLLTAQGKVLADFVVLALADAFLLDGMASAIPSAIAALEQHIVADDVELTPLGEQDHAIGLYGPHAADALAKLGLGTLPGADFTHASVTVDGLEVRVVRVPEPGAGGFVCVLAASQAASFWSACVERAGFVAAGQQAFEVWRIESGVPWYGRDVTADTIALEAPLTAAISFNKGCYLGQEVMERVTARGHVNRMLVGLEIGGEVVPASQDQLWVDGSEVGWVTSAAWSWRLGHPVALGYVRREHHAPGTQLEVRGSSGGARATVRALPLA